MSVAFNTETWHMRKVGGIIAIKKKITNLSYSSEFDLQITVNNQVVYHKALYDAFLSNKLREFYFFKISSTKIEII